MTKYHVSEFDVDTITLFACMLSAVLSMYICFKGHCADCDIEEGFADVPVATATAFPREFVCPNCNETLTFQHESDSDSDGEHMWVQ